VGKKGEGENLTGGGGVDTLTAFEMLYCKEREDEVSCSPLVKQL